jgi:hypothetical protein
MNVVPRDHGGPAPLDRRTPGASLPQEAYRVGRVVGRAKVAYGSECGWWSSDSTTLDRLLTSMKAHDVVTGAHCSDTPRCRAL